MKLGMEKMIKEEEIQRIRINHTNSEGNNPLKIKNMMEMALPKD